MVKYAVFFNGYTNEYSVLGGAADQVDPKNLNPKIRKVGAYRDLLSCFASILFDGDEKVAMDQIVMAPYLSLTADDAESFLLKEGDAERIQKMLLDLGYKPVSGRIPAGVMERNFMIMKYLLNEEKAL